MEIILKSKLTSQDRKQAQTLIDTTTGLLYIHYLGHGHRAQVIDPQ